jgi:tetratricopeptide (TPR) repeat protein
MLVQDARGEPITVGDSGSPGRFEAALGDVLGYTGDPIGRIEAALSQDPMLVLGHILRAHTFLFALQPGFLRKADESIARADALAERASPRELLHLAAAKAWRAGELSRACAAFDAILEEHPRDLLALMFGHQADFFAGHTEALRTRPERALAAWSPDLAGFGYVQAMLAFGLEEAGAFAEAEALGREAVARNPKDVWGIHAVGHVLEMQGRDEEGIAWYGEREADWAPGCYFAVHNAWHLALYHVDREDAEAALAVHDRLIRPGPRSILLNLSDAVALLWRLHLGGVEVGGRWEELADLMARHTLARLHTFDDVHLALALAGAGRDFALAELLGSLEAAARGEGEYARMTRLVGLPVARAAAAFAHGA